MSRAGVPETVSMRVSKHKTRSIFDCHNITNGADLKGAAEKGTQFRRDAVERMGRVNSDNMVTIEQKAVQDDKHAGL